MPLPILNRVLTLETPDRVADGAGGCIQSWTALGTVYAQVRPALGREATAQTHAVSRMRYRITVRSAPPGSPRRPSPEQRFREGTRTYAILSVQDRDDRGRYLTILAEEEVAV